jgi:MarR family transcriptional regulator, organic hydroperoxide resistance regulator
MGTMSRRVNSDKEGADESNDNVAVPSTAVLGPISYCILRAAKSHRALASTLLRPLGLHAGQETLLMELWDEDPQTQSRLISRLQLDASTVTKMVQRLERQGLVRRSVSKADGRAVDVRLTADGIALRSKVKKMWGSLEVLSLKHLSEDERLTLAGLLGKVIKGSVSGQPFDL